MEPYDYTPLDIRDVHNTLSNLNLITDKQLVDLGKDYTQKLETAIGNRIKEYTVIVKVIELIQELRRD